ncbi:MAG: hypothetical protein ABI696_12940, partial [Rubrivivax sp.]
MSRSDDAPFPPVEGIGLPPVDPRLRAALRHAPDHAVEPPAALSAAVIGAARAALRSDAGAATAAPTLAGARGWRAAWRRWRAAAAAGPGPRAAFAGLLVAGIVGMLWRFDPPPEELAPTGAPAAETDATHLRRDRPEPVARDASPPDERRAAELRKAPSPAAAPVRPAPPPAAPPRAAAPANRAIVEPNTAQADAATQAAPAARAEGAAREGQAAQEGAALGALAAARGAVERTARGAAESTARGAAGPLPPSPAAESVGAGEAAADPLARVVGEVGGPGSPSSAQAWWHALRVATAGRWVAAPKAEAAVAPAPDDADAVRAPGGAVLGWLRF